MEYIIGIFITNEDGTPGLSAEVRYDMPVMLPAVGDTLVIEVLDNDDWDGERDTYTIVQRREFVYREGNVYVALYAMLTDQDAS